AVQSGLQEPRARAAPARASVPPVGATNTATTRRPRPLINRRMPCGGRPRAPVMVVTANVASMSNTADTIDLGEGDRMRAGGCFITFEGPEGAGKTTQIERLVRRLENKGVLALQTREPGG